MLYARAPQLRHKCSLRNRPMVNECTQTHSIVLYVICNKYGAIILIGSI